MPSPPSVTLLEQLAPLAPVPDLAEVVAHQASNLFDLWEAWEIERDGAQLDPPFWATAWPGARLLARWLLDNPREVVGRRVIELGCGGGVAAIAAALAGAREVVANDIDSVALHVATRNAAANGVTLVADGCDCSRSGLPQVDVILVADMFYERDVSERLVSMLRQAARNGTTVLVGDAGRPFAPSQGMQAVCQRELTVNQDLEGTDRRRVRLMRVAGDS